LDWDFSNFLEFVGVGAGGVVGEEGLEVDPSRE